MEFAPFVLANRFDRIARLSVQISQWQWKITPIVRPSLTCQIIPDHHRFSLDASSPTGWFSIRSVGQWDAGLSWAPDESVDQTKGAHCCVGVGDNDWGWSAVAYHVSLGFDERMYTITTKPVILPGQLTAMGQKRYWRNNWAKARPADFQTKSPKDRIART